MLGGQVFQIKHVMIQQLHLEQHGLFLQGNHEHSQ